MFLVGPRTGGLQGAVAQLGIAACCSRGDSWVGYPVGVRLEERGSVGARLGGPTINWWWRGEEVDGELLVRRRRWAAQRVMVRGVLKARC